MQKIIGVEGSQQGQFNVMRLAEELKNIEIRSFMIEPENGEITLVFADELEAQINVICEKHVPSALPIPLNNIEQTQIALAEAIEKQEADKLELQIAIVEALEMMMGGGE